MAAMAMMSKYDSSRLCRFRYAPLGAGSIVRHATPLGTTTAPRPPDISALGDPAEGSGTDERR